MPTGSPSQVGETGKRSAVFCVLFGVAQSIQPWGWRWEGPKKTLEERWNGQKGVRWGERGRVSTQAEAEAGGTQEPPCAGILVCVSVRSCVFVHECALRGEKGCTSASLEHVTILKALSVEPFLYATPFQHFP